jgi:ATP-dependent helicase HrpA
VTNREPSTPETLENQARLLGISFDPALPIAQEWQTLAQAIQKHPVVVVCGETGSGKTTQLPKIALACGRGQSGRLIGHTQPRRLAATSVARRIAQELNTPLAPASGGRVGYKIRFQDRTDPNMQIKLMTDGVLLAETQSDPDLRRYDTIIIDEAHERSLNIDFLLGYLRELLIRRKDLRLVITSATLDSDKFSKHFDLGQGPAPVISVSGRLYPVEMRWRPPADDRLDPVEQVITGIEEALQDRSLVSGPSDVLVFLPGEREIRAVADALVDRQRHWPASQQIDVLPLFGRLAQADQERLFHSAKRRRVVLATNIAETSLTVPGIGLVVDTGLARVKRYRTKGKVEQLQVEPISQAQAAQRSGRAGRLGPGVCIRLYSEADFLQRPVHADPEIRRSSLASVLLRMKSLGLPDPAVFPFVDPPARRAIADGLALLTELQAVDRQGALTPIGRLLADLPMDPRLGRMLVAAQDQRCLAEVLVVVSALSIQDPRDRPADQQQAADQMHRRHADELGDFMTWVRLWHLIEDLYTNRQSNRHFDQQLRKHFLSPVRVREWRDLHRQLHDWMIRQDWRLNETPAGAESVHRALLTGLLSNLGCRIDGPSATAGTGSRQRQGPLWQGTHEIKFSIWPGSVLFKKPPRWLMAAEQVETTRLFARTIAAVDPAWIEQAAAHLIKVSVGDPHWEKKQGRVVGMARGVLYGLPIYSQRRVVWAHQGEQAQREAREIFIREGLVGQDMDCRLPFFEHNARLLREIERMEHKARRQDLLVDEGLLEAFYDAHLPQDVVDLESLTSWWRGASKTQSRLLFLDKKDLMRHDAAGITTDQFPKLLEASGLRLALDYKFEPGAPDDGLTVHVPVAVINQLEARVLDWLVPGMRREKVLALIKSLPGRHRRHLVPVEAYASGFCERWGNRAGECSLVSALCEDIAQETGVRLMPDDFKRDQLAAHWQAWIRVVDEHGRLVGQGRDLSVLKQAHGAKATAALAALAGLVGQLARVSGGSAAKGAPDQATQAELASAPLTQTPQTDWTFGDLPAQRLIELAGQSVMVYPCLKDVGEGVVLTQLDDPEQAGQVHAMGLIRLFGFQIKEQLRSLEKDLAKQPALGLGWSAAGWSGQPLAAVTGLAMRRAFLAGESPRSSQAFSQALAQGRSRFLLQAQEATRWLTELASQANTIQKRLASLRPMKSLVADIEAQLDRLFTKDFFHLVPAERQRHYSRYLQAILMRLEKVRSDPSRDAAQMTELNGLEQPFWRWARQHNGPWSEAMTDFRWQLEELRVALFAQSLRTPSPVSVKRLQKTWQTLQTSLR